MEAYTLFHTRTHAHIGTEPNSRDAMVDMSFARGYHYFTTAPTIDHSDFICIFFLDQLDKMEKRKDDQTVAPTSFLWAAYMPNRYYFEVR